MRKRGPSKRSSDVLRLLFHSTRLWIAFLIVVALAAITGLAWMLYWLLTNVWEYPRLADAANFVLSGVLIYLNWEGA